MTLAAEGPGITSARKIDTSRAPSRPSRPSPPSPCVPTGGALAVNEGNAVKVWDLASKSEKALELARGGRVSQVIFSRDGRTLAEGAQDGKVKVWDLHLLAHSSPAAAAPGRDCCCRPPCHRLR